LVGLLALGLCHRRSGIERRALPMAEDEESDDGADDHENAQRAPDDRRGIRLSRGWLFRTSKKVLRIWRRRHGK
jgi:hypothetical protein